MAFPPHDDHKEAARKRAAELKAAADAARVIEMVAVVEKAAGIKKDDTRPITDDNVRRVVTDPGSARPVDVTRWATDHARVMREDIRINPETRVAAFGPKLRETPAAGHPHPFDPTKATAIVLLGPDSSKPGEAGAVDMAARGIRAAARNADHNTVFIDINGMTQAQIKKAIEDQARQIYGSLDNARGRLGVHVVAHGDERGNYLARVGPDGRAANAPIENILGAIRDESAAPLVSSVAIANCHMGIRENMRMGPNQLVMANSRVDQRTGVKQFLDSFAVAAATRGSIMPTDTMAEYYRLGHVGQRQIIRDGRLVSLDGGRGSDLALSLDSHARELGVKIEGARVAGVGIIPGGVADKARIAGGVVVDGVASLDGARVVTPGERVVADPDAGKDRVAAAGPR